MIIKHNSAFFIFTFLGMLTAFGPFITDMYLPALPVMTEYFATGVSMVQAGLTSSMLGLALGQLLFGPISDKYGRKAPLSISTILFMIVTVLCVFSPNIETFIVLRFFQGVSASGGIVIARSIATDKFKNRNLTKALVVVGAINGIAPIAAPVIGGAVLDYIGWKGIFWIMLFIGIILFGLCLIFAESLSHQRRSRDKLSKTFKNFKAILKNRRYMNYTLEQAFAMGVLFAYIAGSPFIIQNHYGFSPFYFSIIFAVNAIAIGIGSALAMRFKSSSVCLFTSCSIMGICGLMIIMVSLFEQGIVIFEITLFILCLAMGLSFPTATSEAMNAVRKQAGAGSAILGASGFLFGSIVSPFVGIGNIMTSSGIVVVFCTIGAFYFTFCADRQK